MTLATCVDTETKIRSFDEFCTAISQYIDVVGQKLNNELFTDEEFEAVAQLNDAFSWPDESNWVEWREGLRQIFFYSQLNEHQLNVLETNDLSWLQGAPYFLHIANDDAAQVAYLPTRDDMRTNDRMQRGRIGRFFNRHLEMDNENLIRELAAGFQSTQYKYVLSRDPEMFARVYKNGPRSCMSHSFDRYNHHPASAYGSGDFAILASYPADGTLTNPALSFSGRAVISIAQNRLLRIYGNDDSIKEMMTLLNVKTATAASDPEYLFYDRFLKLHDRGVIFPYLDFRAVVTDDPLTPRSGARARLRVNDHRKRGRHVNAYSTNGRVGWQNSRFANSTWEETDLELHDAQVEPNWQALEQRFNALTAETTERVIRPILWNSAPVVQTYQCCLCAETHTINPDRSNIVEVRTLNSTQLAARSHFASQNAALARQVFAYREVTEHVLLPASDNPVPENFLEYWPTNVHRLPIADVSLDNEKWATYDFILNNAEDFYITEANKSFVVSTHIEEDIFGRDFLLHCPSAAVKQINLMDARFTSVRNAINQTHLIIKSCNGLVPGQSPEERRLMLFMTFLERFGDKSNPDRAYRLLTHSWKNWEGTHNLHECLADGNARIEFLLYLIYQKSRNIIQNLEPSHGTFYTNPQLREAA